MGKDLDNVFYTPKDNIKLLNDASSSGKKRDWKGKKQRSGLMAQHFYHAGLQKKAKRMEECCNVLTFKLTNEGLKLYQAYNCKVRLCPMCNWRRSLKIAWQNKQIVEKANQDHKLRWVFLTLTVKNCKADQLKETVSQMMKSWNRFIGYKRIKQAVKGYFRALEITKDWDEFITKKRYYTNPKYYDRQGLKSGDRNPNYKTYHPHFHVLMCVQPSYFGKSYINRKEWQGFWQRGMKLDYLPIVDVRVVKPKKEAADLEQIEQEIKDAIKEKEIKEQKAIQEVSKYPIKDTDVLPADRLTTDGIETVYTLDNAIAYKRLIGYGGILKEIHKELNLDDAEDGDLIRTSDDDPAANAIAEVTAYWHVGIKDYVIKDQVINPETGEIL